MSEKKIRYRIRDVKSDNEILLKNEPGFRNGVLRIGNGASKWINLPEITGGSIEFQDDGEGNVIIVNSTTSSGGGGGTGGNTIQDLEANRIYVKDAQIGVVDYFEDNGGDELTAISGTFLNKEGFIRCTNSGLEVKINFNDDHFNDLNLPEVTLATQEWVQENISGLSDEVTLGQGFLEDVIMIGVGVSNTQTYPDPNAIWMEKGGLYVVDPDGACNTVYQYGSIYSDGAEYGITLNIPTDSPNEEETIATREWVQANAGGGSTIKIAEISLGYSSGNTSSRDGEAFYTSSNVFTTAQSNTEFKSKFPTLASLLSAYAPLKCFYNSEDGTLVGDLIMEYINDPYIPTISIIYPAGETFLKIEITGTDYQVNITNKEI